MPDIVTKSRENWMSVCVGKKEGSLKILTHNSNEPTSSSTEVKFLSNPTRMTATMGKYMT